MNMLVNHWFTAIFICCSDTCQTNITVDFNNTREVIGSCPACGKLQAFKVAVPMAIFYKFPDAQMIDNRVHNGSA